MRLPIRCLLVPLVAASLCLPAVAAPGQKPDATLVTKNIEASVTIDPKLKAYPKLVPILLDSGKREMAKWRADADKERKELPDIFRDGRRFSFDRTYEERSAIGRYISILRTDFGDGLGAHPSTVVNTLMWDTQTNKLVSVRPLFKETKDGGPTMQTLAKAVRAALVVEKKARDIPPEEANDPTWLKGVQPSLLKIGGIALAPSTEAGKSAGLLFYFSPYDVGPYAEGAYTIFLPWTVFKAHLSSEGEALFGGARPAGDAKRDEQ